MSRQSDYITLVRTETRKLWDSWRALKSYQKEWTASDYGNTLITPTNSQDQNFGITGAQVGAVVFTTADAIEAVMNAGNATNIARLL